MAYPDHMSSTEKKIVDKLIKKALGLGYFISVHDGEEWSVRMSIDYDTITDEIATTDCTTLLFRTSDTSRAGWILLIHGNEDDVISDHSDTPLMNQLVEGIIT